MTLKRRKKKRESQLYKRNKSKFIIIRFVCLTLLRFSMFKQLEINVDIEIN